MVLIDSLDQLDPANNARNLFWLPTHLPSYVKIIVSTLEEDMYECFPMLKVNFDISYLVQCFLINYLPNNVFTCKYGNINTEPITNLL